MKVDRFLNCHLSSCLFFDRSTLLLLDHLALGPLHQIWLRHLKMGRKYSNHRDYSKYSNQSDSQWRAPLLTTPHMFCCVAAVTLNTSHKANLL